VDILEKANEQRSKKEEEQEKKDIPVMGPGGMGQPLMITYNGAPGMGMPSGVNPGMGMPGSSMGYGGMTNGYAGF